MKLKVFSSFLIVSGSVALFFGQSEGGRELSRAEKSSIHGAAPAAAAIADKYCATNPACKDTIKDPVGGGNNDIRTCDGQYAEKTCPGVTVDAGTDRQNCVGDLKGSSCTEGPASSVCRTVYTCTWDAAQKKCVNSPNPTTNEAPENCKSKQAAPGA